MDDKHCATESIDARHARLGSTSTPERHMPAATPQYPETMRIAVVDDDTSVLEALARMIRVCGHDAQPFSSAESFLAALDHQRPEVLLVDLRLPTMDGLALQALLIKRGFHIPTIFLSGWGDIPSSVRALRGGAMDFLEKPCDELTLLASLERATSIARRARDADSARSVVANRVATLTRREREVFRWVVTGRLNKQIAALLGTGEKTVKVHRGRVMTKMNAGSVAALVRMFDQVGEECILAQETRSPGFGSYARDELKAAKHRGRIRIEFRGANTYST
jgi:FixJ family two-component response regulator